MWPLSSGTGIRSWKTEHWLIVISQSGETADSLAALREAKERGAKVLGIVNVVGSSIAREADNVMYTWAGPEIAVATTKAYSSQLIALYLLAMKFAYVRGNNSQMRRCGDILKIFRNFRSRWSCY